MANEKKQMKTIFHSTENSNFILNMTEEQYSKIASIGLLTACFFVSIFTAVAEVRLKVSGTTSYSIAAVGLAVTGVFCMILALIALIKGYVNKKALVPAIAFAFMAAWGVVSLINSYDKSVALYGFPQRGEGLLAIVFYLSFFITALSIKRESAVKVLLDGTVLSGLLNAVWGLIQVFTGTLGRYSFVSIKTKINAASGIAQSPLFLAMLLSISLTAAVIGAISSAEKRRRTLYLVSAVIFSFTMVFTYSFIGICGLVFAVISAIATVLITKAPKLRLLTALAVVVPALAAVLLVELGAIGEISSYKLYDGRELWWADSYMRISAGSDVNSETLDLNNTLDVYMYMNEKTVDIIKKHPLTGTGPEQLAYPQIKTFGFLDEDSDISDVITQNKNIFDKCYNEYLYTAATRGIPSLLALLAVVICSIVLGYRSMKEERGFARTAVFFTTLCGALLFLIGCSNITFSPIYWSVVGAACATYFADTKKASDTTATKNEAKK